MRRLSRVCLALAAALTGWAGYSLLTPGRPAHEPPMTVDDPDRDLGVVPAAVGREVTFVIGNPADRPRRVIGLADG